MLRRRRVNTLSCRSSVQSSRSVVLAQVCRQLLVSHPPQCPTTRPGSSVSSRVLYSHLIVEGIEIGPRKSLDNLQLVGVGKSAVGEPKVFVKPSGINN